MKSKNTSPANNVNPSTQVGTRKVRSRGGEIWWRLRRNTGAMIGMAIVILMVLSAVFSSVIFDFDTQIIGYNPADRLMRPCLEHPFGTDDMGRDLFCRVLYGARYSLLIGVLAVVVAALIGIPIGSFAGYYGGKWDDLIMRIMDIFSAIPPILMGIVIVSALGANTLNLILAIGITNIPHFARITRASVMSVKNQQFIEAAKTSGLNEASIIFGHVLPNCLSPIIVNVTLRVASSIVSASSLSFLGLGIAAPLPEWGAMLSAGREFIRGYSYMTLFPGLAIMITVLSLNLLGDGLRDALDPKLRK